MFVNLNSWGSAHTYWATPAISYLGQVHVASGICAKSAPWGLGTWLVTEGQGRVGNWAFRSGHELWNWLHCASTSHKVACRGAEPQLRSFGFFPPGTSSFTTTTPHFRILFYWPFPSSRVPQSLSFVVHRPSTSDVEMEPDIQWSRAMCLMLPDAPSHDRISFLSDPLSRKYQGGTLQKSKILVR